MSWRVERLGECPSTNAVVAARAGEGAGLVVVTDHQTAGRGRLDRVWETPAGQALTFSALVDPGLPDAQWPMLPLVTGLAVADVVTEAGASARLTPWLKWPNDVLVDGAKVAGILVERTPERLAVVGVGLNVLQTVAPVPTATSLRLLGAELPEDAPARLLVSALDALDRRLEEWRRGADVLEEYRSRCATLARAVHVDLPGGASYDGMARAIDDEGRLVVEADGETRVVSAGDVVHASLGPLGA